MTKKTAIPTPKDLSEANQFLAKIKKEQYIIDIIKSIFRKKIDKLKSEAMADIKPHQNKVSQLLKGLFIYAETHRKELTEGNREIIEIPAGSFGWRMTPTISFRNAKNVLNLLKLLGLDRFIRIEEKIDKEAMLKDLEAAKKLDGVYINQKEKFIVTIAKDEPGKKTGRLKVVH